jgi:hypothetical protein
MPIPKDSASLGACLSAHLTTSGILRFNSDASENLRNVAPPSSHLRVASAFAWTSTNCRWTVSHDSSRVHQCVALLGLQSLRDSGSLGFLADPVVFFTPLLRCVNFISPARQKNTLSTCSSPLALLPTPLYPRTLRCTCTASSSDIGKYPLCDLHRRIQPA